MSVAAPARAAAPNVAEPTPNGHLAAGERAPGSPSRARRVAFAFIALLVAYGALSMLNDPRGTLGTDTGGKLASLQIGRAHV